MPSRELEQRTSGLSEKSFFGIVPFVTFSSYRQQRKRDKHNHVLCSNPSENDAGLRLGFLLSHTNLTVFIQSLPPSCVPQGWRVWTASDADGH